jgi:hypothetical protein
VANEEVAKQQVLVKRSQRLLKLVLRLREGHAVAGNLAVDHGEDASSDGQDAALDVVGPGVDFSGLLGSGAGAECTACATEIARNRESIAHKHVVVIFEDGEAAGERLLAELLVGLAGADLDHLDGFDTHELCDKACELRLWRRTFARF